MLRRNMDLYHLTAEATTASLNLFLQHDGTDALLGTYLTALIKNLQLELGVKQGACLNIVTTCGTG